MRTSGPCRSPRTRAARPASDSARVVARHVSQRACVVGRARGRRRARLTARHGRGVPAVPLRAFPGGGRVQRGAAGEAQPAAARAAAGPLLGFTSAGAPVRGGGARSTAALCAPGSARARGAVRAAPAGPAAAAATGLLRAGVSAAAAIVAQMLRPGLPRGHRWLASADALRGVRWRRRRSSPGLHAATTSTTRTSATLRASGATLLCPSPQATTTST